MTTAESQIKLNNQSAIVRAQYKIYNIAIFLAQVNTTKKMSNIKSSMSTMC